MQTSRRDFFKVAAVGGVAATIFGFDLKPAYAQLKELKIAPYLHYRRQSQERHATSNSRGRRSRPSYQSRNAVPQRLFPRTGYAEPAALGQTASSQTRRDGLAGYLLGRRARRNCPVDQENTRRDFRRKGCRWPPRESLRRYLVYWWLHRHK
jgi:hypothetical protein